MSYWPEDGVSPAVLHGAEGDLVNVRVRVDSRSLEAVLDALATLKFPINPEIRHGHPATWVEFPAYDVHVGAVRSVLRKLGPRSATVEVDAGPWLSGVVSGGDYRSSLPPAPVE